VSDQKTDRRVRRTRQLLSNALIELIMQKGFDKITVQDILDRADVGRSTFYTHFMDKDDLLAKSVEGLQTILIEQVADGAEAEGYASVLPSLALFRHTQGGHTLYKAMIGGGGIDLVVKGLRDMLINYAMERIALISPKSAQPRIPAELIAITLTGALLSLLMWWLDNGMPHTPEFMDEVFQQLVTPGVLAAVGIPS